MSGLSAFYRHAILVHSARGKFPMLYPYAKWLVTIRPHFDNAGNGAVRQHLWVDANGEIIYSDLTCDPIIGEIMINPASLEMPGAKIEVQGVYFTVPHLVQMSTLKEYDYVTRSTF